MRGRRRCRARPFSRLRYRWNNQEPNFRYSLIPAHPIDHVAAWVWAIPELPCPFLKGAIWQIGSILLLNDDNLGQAELLNVSTKCA